MYKPGSQINRSPVKSLSCQQMRRRWRVPSVCLRGWSLKPVGLLHMFKWKFSTTTEATEQDEELQSLKAIMLVGWPELKSEVPIPVQEYWNNIIKRKSTWIMGVNASLSLGWSDQKSPHHTNSNIKEVIFQCSVSAEFHAGNSKEPKQASKVPNCPWSRVAMALFTLQKKEYGCSGGLLLRLCWSSITQWQNFSNRHLVLKGTI